MRKIFIVGGGSYSNYANWILPLGFSITPNLNQAEVVLLAGGEDWDTSWYYKGSNPHPSVGSNIYRDKDEFSIIDQAIKNKQKIFGVCRGSQILPVLAGKEGRIVQHQHNPDFIHNVETFDGYTIPVSSTHHQCAFPYFLPKEAYKVLAWSSNLVKFRWFDKQNPIEAKYPETEVVFYPNVGGGALGYQPHFEMIYEQSFKQSIMWAQSTFLKFVDNKL